MTTVLSIVNFTLIIIVFFLIILLYLRQSRLLNMENDRASTIKEMEDLLTAYIIEMKDENEKFLKQMNIRDRAKPKKEEKSSTTLIHEKKNASPQSSSIDLFVGEENPLHLLPKYEENKQDVSNKKEELSVIDEEETIDSIVNKAMKLQNQGLSINEIAKRLNKGKTEIELLLKFRQN